SWDHPNMPWDNTCLHLVSFNKNNLCRTKPIDKNAWISQPQFDSKGNLYFIKEGENGFANICKFNYETETSSIVLENEREYASPAWNFGTRTYALYEDKVIASSWQNGKMQLE